MTLAWTCLPRYCNHNSIPTTRTLSHRRILSRWTALAALVISVAGAHAQNTFAPQPVGSRSGEQAVIVKSAAGGTVTTVEVLAAGNPAGDFAAGAGSSTCLNATLPAGGSCHELVTFAPSSPGLKMGAVVLLDSAHQVLGATLISGTGRGGLGVLVPGNVSIVAGVQGVFVGVFDGGQATDATLNLPAGITMDGAGNMYIADSLHNRVRMVCGAAATATIAKTTCTTAGVISTIAGDDTPAYTGDGGPAGDATLSTPNGVAVEGAGNLYIADTGNDAIRMISAATGTISTVAGGARTLCAGSTNPVGDGCPATQARLYQPWGVTLDAAGNLYIADTFNHRIREVSSASGIITTIAGTGFTQSDGGGGYNGDNILATAAELNFPFAVAFDPHGNMYIPDSDNQRVREVLAIGGVITPASKIVTFAGDGRVGGNQSCSPDTKQASQSEFAWPEAVALDAAGNVYISDTQNAGIRKVNAVTLDLSTLVQAGCGQEYNYGKFLFAELYGPKGLYVDGLGNVYVADYYNMVVRQVQSNYAAIDDYTNDPIRQGLTFGPTLQQVENDGNAALDLTSLTAGTNTAIDPTVTNACTTGILAADSDCMIGALFAPALDPVLLAPQNESGTITTDENTQPAIPAPNNPLKIDVFGYAGPGYGTVTTITSAPNPSAYLQEVTFVIYVATGSGNLDGSVTIFDTYNGTTTSYPNLYFDSSTSGSYRAVTFKITTLGVGQHTIVAAYSGDEGHYKSKSTDDGTAPLIQVVQAASITTLTSSLNPSTVGASVTFTAVVAGSPSTVTPHGTVTFQDGATNIASVSLTTVKGVQQATLTTSGLANGPHQITAAYNGDAAKPVLGSASNLVEQDVQAPAKLSLSSNLNPAYEGNSVTFTATISSKATQPASGTILFFDNGAQIDSATLAGNPATAKIITSTLSLGTHPITATYAGDSYNTAAQSGTLDQVVTLDAFSVTVTPATLTLKAGSNATVSVNVKSIGGYSDSIVFGCASLPAQVNCEFRPIHMKLPAGATETAQLTIDTNNPLSGGPSAMNRSSRIAGTALAGLLSPFGIFFGWLFWRQRRRAFSLITMLLVLTASAAMIATSGCGNGISLSSAAPGTYTLQVSGTGSRSYFTRYQDVKLTITK